MQAFLSEEEEEVDHEGATSPGQAVDARPPPLSMCVPVSPVATFCEEEAVDVTHQTVTYGVEDEYDSPLVLEELPEPVKVTQSCYPNWIKTAATEAV